MELRPPPHLKIAASGAGTLAALIVAPLFWDVARAAARAQVSGAVMLLPMACALTWAMWRWVAALWSRTLWRLAADSEGISLRYRSHKRHVPWSQISTCREEASSQERDGASWVTVRGTQDEVLLMWERSWFGHNRRSLREFDRFTDFVRLKVAQHGASST